MVSPKGLIGKQPLTVPSQKLDTQMGTSRLGLELSVYKPTVKSHCIKTPVFRVKQRKDWGLV